MEQISQDNQHLGRSYSMRVIRKNSHGLPVSTLVPEPQSKSRSTSLFGSFQSTSYNETRTSSAFDPLDILIPITDGCLILMAIIFVIALVIVAIIVAMAIIVKIRVN